MTTREPEVVRFRGDNRAYTGIIVSEGTRNLHVLVAAEHVRLVNMPKAEERYATPLYWKCGAEPYPVKRAARIILRMHRRHGGTASALRALKELT